ncbi:PAS domain S-box protein [Oscillatoria acuminata]|uniref:histidine kinase n=1 Tax=Oscillatoria acuminata PCC 6304 TaxID=56110 RepID=K9TJI5_9CYAN|nr:PAS domain S-box protein [Oscillatoria acuminata]AFY82184.1 PAS domain S-box [Oscillatoria acuminata PCC 6304]
MPISEPAIPVLNLEAAIAHVPVCVPPHTPVNEVLKQMNRVQSTSCHLDQSSSSTLNSKTLSSCAVVQENDNFLGILIERDLVKLIASGQSLESITVGEVINPSPGVRQSQLQHIFSVLPLLRQYHISHLPILDESDGFMGIISTETLREILQPTNLLQLRQVAEVMTPQIISANPTTSLLDIAKLMISNQVSCVMICQSGEGKITQLGTGNPGDIMPLGIITEGDLIQIQGLEIDLNRTPVEQMMSSPVFAIAPEDSLWIALQKMQQHHVGRLAVTGIRGELLGIITQTTLLNSLNPLEMYKVIDVMQDTISTLEAEKIELLQNRTIELEKRVRWRTAEQEQLIASLEASSQRDRLLAQVSLQIRKSLNLDEILQTTVEQVRQLLQSHRVLVYQFSPTMEGKVVAESVESGYSGILGTQVRDSCFEKMDKTAYLNGRKQVIADIYQAGLTPCHQQLLEQFQVRANLVVPICIQVDPAHPHLWGLLIAQHCNEPRPWQASEIDLLDKISVHIAIAIHQAQLYQDTQIELAERRRAEAALRSSEQLYATLAEASPVGIFRTDPGGKCIYINDRACEMLGLSRQAALGEGWFQALHPQDYARVVAEWAKSTQFKTPFACEYRFCRPNGQVSWVFGQTIAEIGPDQELMGYIGTVTDISDRKQAEQALRTLNVELEMRVSQRTEQLEKTVQQLQGEIEQRQQAQQELLLVKERLQYLLWASPTIIYSCQVQDPYTTTFISYNVIHILGYEPKQFLNNPQFWWDCIHPEDVEIVETGFSEISTRQNLSLEYRLRHADGRYRWVQDDFRVVRNAQGQVMEIVGSCVDISDRKLAESELQESEAQLSNFFESANDLIQTVDAQGKILSVNRAWRETLGYSQEEVQHLSMSDIIHPHCNSRYYQLLSTLNGGCTQTVTFEIKALKSNGRSVFLEGKLSLEIDENPSIIHGVFRDITRRKIDEVKLKRQAEVLQTIFDNIPLMLVFFDQEGQIQLLNPALEKTLGWSLAEAQTEDTLVKCYPDPEERQKVLDGIEGGTGKWIEVKARTRQGREMDAAWANIRLSDGSGIGIGQDITERKGSEAALRDSEKLFRSTFNGATIGLVHSNIKGQFLRVNQKYCEILGYSQEELLLKSWRDIIHPDDVEENIKCLNRVIIGETRESFCETRYYRQDGSIIWASLTVCLVSQPSGEPDYFIAAVEDITDRKKAEAEKEKRDRYLTALVEIQHQLLNSSVDTNLYELIMSILGPVSGASRLYIFENSRDSQGCLVTSQKAEWCAEGIESQWDNPDLQNCPYDEFFTRLPNTLGKGEILEGIVTNFSDSERLVLEPQGIQAILLLPLMVNGDFFGFIGFDNCIEAQPWDTLEVSLLSSAAAAIALAKERQLTQAALARQLAAVEATTDGIGILNENSEYIYLNSAHAKIFGYDDPKDLLGKTWKELYYPEEGDKIEKEVFSVLGASGQWSGETLAKRRDGTTFPEEISLTLIAGGGLICVARDITTRKQSEQQIKASLHEKEVLLKEIHHRVKNNLQIIHSLLKLQSSYTKDPQALQMFRDSQNRIRSMALIHELLYRSHNLASINFAEYINQLTTNLLRAYNITVHSQPEILINVDAIELGIDTAIPCGLMINELITNAFKYAFVDGFKGRISIDFHKDGSDTYELKIADNGVGLPADLDFRNTESLGLKLVCNLTRQLDGEISLDRSQGSCFTIRFQELTYQPRG